MGERKMKNKIAKKFFMFCNYKMIIEKRDKEIKNLQEKINQKNICLEKNYYKNLYDNLYKHSQKQKQTIINLQNDLKKIKKSK